VAKLLTWYAVKGVVGDAKINGEAPCQNVGEVVVDVADGKAPCRDVGESLDDEAGVNCKIN
jgi:hypothetical protein